MAKLNAKWINLDANTLQDDGSGNLQIKIDPAAELESSATGIRIKAGSIAADRLADVFVKADGSVPMSGNLDLGSNELLNVASPTAANSAATKAYADALVAGLDFQADVLDKQVDGTLDPGASPASGARYILTDTANLHANFGTITGVENNDIVEFDGTSWVVSYDVSVKGSGALVWNTAAGYFEFFDGTNWSEFGGLSGVTAGAGLSKTGNTLDVNVDGVTIEVATDALQVKAAGISEAHLATSVAGNGLTGGAGTPLALGTLTADWDLGGGSTATFTLINVKDPVNAQDVATKAYVDANIGGASSRHVELYTVTATDITNKSLTLPVAVKAGSESSTEAHVKGAVAQFYGDDFTVSGTTVSWTGLGWDGVLSAGDKITFVYEQA